MPLGEGTSTYYLYDRGGKVRLAQFSAVISDGWSRALNQVSEASVTVNADECGCDWLANIRSVRQELVVFRSFMSEDGEITERVWEGPIVRVIYKAGTVEVQARDVLWWMTRRSSRGRFTDPDQNGVREAQVAISQAFTYDDPNVLPYLQINDAGAGLVTTAVNRHEQTYYDHLSDLVDDGIFHTTIGRRILVWDAAHPYGKTLPLSVPADLDADVAVMEDGLALATRVILTTDNTYGASTPEPVIINHAHNPSLEATGEYFQVPRPVIEQTTDGPLNMGQHFFYTREKGSHGSGSWVGQVLGEPPVKPKPIGKRPDRPDAPHAPSRPPGASDAEWKVILDAYHAEYAQYKKDLRAYHAASKSYSADQKEHNKRINQYNARLRSYRDAEVVLYSTQTTACHEGQVVAANLFVWQTGPRTSKLGIRLVGIDDDGEVADRSFQEGPLIRVASTTVPVQLFVKGPVPAATARFRVEVYRDTDKTKWPTNDCGFRFDKFGIWDQGRVETWFDGDSKTITVPGGKVDYSWEGAVDASASDARFSHPKVDDIYGLVESLENSTSQRSAVSLTRAATRLLAPLTPAPMVMDVPADIPLNPASNITITQLVAGTVVPVTTTDLCRNMTAGTTLYGLSVTRGPAPESAESVKVTLVAKSYPDAGDPDAASTLSLEAPVQARVGSTGSPQFEGTDLPSEGDT